MQLLVQALVISQMDNCNSLLAGYSHVTPLLCDIHLLPVVACIRFKMMVLALKAVNRSAPIYLQTPVTPHAPLLHSTGTTK